MVGHRFSVKILRVRIRQRLDSFDDVVEDHSTAEFKLRRRFDDVQRANFFDVDEDVAFDDFKNRRSSQKQLPNLITQFSTQNRPQILKIILKFMLLTVSLHSRNWFLTWVTERKESTLYEAKSLQLLHYEWKAHFIFLAAVYYSVKMTIYSSKRQKVTEFRRHSARVPRHEPVLRSVRELLESREKVLQVVGHVPIAVCKDSEAAVWPDWAIFESSWCQIILIK